MFDNGAISVRLLSLFHIVTPPLLLWAIARLGYAGGDGMADSICWVVVPINYLWRPGFDVNWARGPFFQEQHVLPGWLYLAGYLVVVPLAIYYPTHLLLEWWAKRSGIDILPPQRT
jgi:hypothetical protein